MLCVIRNWVLIEVLTKYTQYLHIQRRSYSKMMYCSKQALSSYTHVTELLSVALKFQMMMVLNAAVSVINERLWCITSASTFARIWRQMCSKVLQMSSSIHHLQQRTVCTRFMWNDSKGHKSDLEEMTGYRVNSLSKLEYTSSFFLEVC